MKLHFADNFEELRDLVNHRKRKLIAIDFEIDIKKFNQIVEQCKVIYKVSIGEDNREWINTKEIKSYKETRRGSYLSILEGSPTKGYILASRETGIIVLDSAFNVEKRILLYGQSTSV